MWEGGPEPRVSTRDTNTNTLDQHERLRPKVRVLHIEHTRA